MEKHNIDLRLALREAPDLGAKLQARRAEIDGWRFGEMLRLVAFLRTLPNRTRGDLALLTELPPRESRDPEMRGIVARGYGRAADGREVVAIRWRGSHAAILLLDPVPSPDPSTGTMVWPVEVFDLVDGPALASAVRALTR